MPRQERRRATAALVTIVFSIFILVAPLVAMAIAQNSPRIAFMNPSDYSAGASSAPLVLSDRQTGSDEEDSINERTYRLLASTANTPSEAVVEFEIDVPELNLGGVTTINIGVADRVAPDAFEYNWDISGIPDGEYELRAILYSGSGVGAIEVARAERLVIVNTSNTSAAADIVYPGNGAQTGFYVNPKSGSTNTVVRIEFSAGTSSVRVFYTVSDTGEAPVWKSCAGPEFSGVGGDTQASAGGQITLRCVLQSIDQGAGSVTGIGVVANNSQRRSYNQNLNQAGDSVRVLPYKQDADSAATDPATVRANGTFSSEVCSPAQFVTILDQLGNPIAGISVDVHAQGPNDQLKFNTGGLFFAGPPSSNNAPDSAHSGTETAYNCGEIPPNAAPGSQGDHNIAGGADIKHVEGSTSNTGTFGWNFFSTSAGTTQATVWADEDDDDRFCDDEPSAVASVGWNQPAPAPAGETPIVFDCPIPTPPPPPTDGTASPSTTGPEPDPDDCTVQGTDGDDVLEGTDGNDVICGGAGDDEIRGYGGDDIIRGGSGNDIIAGDEGDDIIDGGEGNDRVNGGFGNDVIDGRSGTDVLVGGADDDVLRGGGSVDGLQGGSGDDVIQGGSGDDVGDGQGGSDVLKGFKGEDILRGGSGPDTLKGGPQNDQLTGGGGDDKISGGTGRDQCSGGGGRDKLRQCEA